MNYTGCEGGGWSVGGASLWTWNNHILELSGEMQEELDARIGNEQCTSSATQVSLFQLSQFSFDTL